MPKVKYQQKTTMYKTGTSGRAIEWMRVVKFTRSSVWRLIDGECRRFRRKSGADMWHESLGDAISYLKDQALKDQARIRGELNKQNIVVGRLKVMSDKHNERF